MNDWRERARRVRGVDLAAVQAPTLTAVTLTSGTPPAESFPSPAPAS